MMLYLPPGPKPDENAVVGAIHYLSHRLRPGQRQKQWTGLLARQVFARRKAIEGDTATLDKAERDGDSSDDEDESALDSYRRAMTYGLARVASPSFIFSSEFILALHFMMTEHDYRNRAGNWREREVAVRDPAGIVVYRCPDPASVPGLMDEFVRSLNDSDRKPDMYRAAIAHLNLLRIHPFEDGNGRMARALQALIFAQADLAPEIGSLEEYCGEYTWLYNDALAATGAELAPHTDTRQWVRFCLSAHYQQALALVWRTARVEALHQRLLAELAERRASNALPPSEMPSLNEPMMERLSLARPDWFIAPARAKTLGYRLTDASSARTLETDKLGDLTRLLQPLTLSQGEALPNPFEVLRQNATL
jgi:Fic family protein